MITIIIIIILSTVAISFTFGENGLISKGQHASKMYANDTAYTVESMLNVESYINNIVPPKVSDLIGGEKFQQTTKVEDDSGDIMWVPGGFSIAEDSATDIDRGVVITDGPNEFVWIPVSDSDLAEMYSTTTPESASDITLSKSSWEEEETTTKIYSKLRRVTSTEPGTNSGRREPDILADTDIGDASTIDARGIKLLKSELGYSGTEAQVLKSFAQNMVNEYLTVFKSIKEYDGFYIGRYELTGTAEKPTVQRHQPVLTAATSSANTWYGLKDASNRVVTGEGKHAQSYMIYGNQWDEVMDWLVDTEAKKSDEINVDSSTWGNFSTSSGAAAVEGAGKPQKSGYSDAWSANNIYDLARKLL